MYKGQDSALRVSLENKAFKNILEPALGNQLQYVVCPRGLCSVTSDTEGFLIHPRTD